jgi:hypothetical protein
MELSEADYRPELQFVIVSKEMVWQFYYDESGSKYFRELTGRDARKFIESRSSEDLRELDQNTSPNVSFKPE